MPTPAKQSNISKEMHKPKVSIIIVNYNTREITTNTIRSVYEKTVEIEFETILVDNASSDGTAELIKKTFPQVKVIENDTNVGFGRANNIGIEQALGDYIFMLNPDTLLLNNSIKIICDYLDANHSVAAACGNLYSADLRPALSFSRCPPGIFNEIDTFFFNMLSKFLYRNSSTFNHSSNPIQFKGTISGADLMMRRKIFNDLKGFDSDFFMYYEETELMHRVNRSGYKIASVPDAKIIHLEGASETRKYNTLVRSFKSKWIYFKKTGKYNLTPFIHAIFQATALQRISLFTILNKKEKATYWKMVREVESTSYNER